MDGLPAAAFAGFAAAAAMALGFANSKRPTSVPYFFTSFAFLGSRVFHMAYSGVATATDEYEPQIRPMAMANAKSLSVSPPKNSMASTGMSDVSVVLMVRTSTWLMEWFAIVMNVHLMSSPRMLSLMRWNTTTVS